jgi:molybdate transport system substrate-binding protein
MIAGDMQLFVNQKSSSRMLGRAAAVLVIHLAMCLAAPEGRAMEKLTVMTSGGFSLAYRQMLPEFEREGGISVTTLSGASQGTGSKTIKSQLEQGADVDVVILSKEGLKELIEAGRIADGSQAELATVPLGAAVRQGSEKPDITSVDAFKRAVLNARLVTMGESTSGIYMKNEVFPKLGIADKVSLKMVPRGTDATGMVANGEADLAIGPVSELVHQPGIDLVALLPTEAQFVQTFAAAMVKTAHNPQAARKLIEFLASERTVAAIKNSGMEPAYRRQ